MALLGKSGSGKTSLIRAAICLKEGPRPVLDGQDFCSSPDYSKVSAVGQEPAWQVLAESSKEELSLISRYHPVDFKVAQNLMGPYFDTPFNRLSDGYKRRFVLSSVLAGEPKYLLLDEPLSNLDDEAVKLVSSSFPSTSLIAEHRVKDLRALVQRAYVIEGKAKEIELDLLWSERFLKSHGLRGFRVFREKRPLGEVLLSAEVKGIKLEVRKREVLCIVGPNGAGKTTTIRELSRKGVRPVFQSPDLQFFFRTVKDEVGSSEAMQLFQLTDKASRSPYSLSFGEKMRVLMASALASEAKVVAFDEPSAGMDGDALVSFVKALELMVEQDRGVVVATHDSDVIDLCDSTIRLSWSSW
ncbi:ABC transporter ATP-binding protein [Sulfodiicoccus acidiphilus]|uniref:ABC transporter ATP-binding protein n=1 Tax=Sulfodiicoccus acidiphilus TaxID=1670455 RepID=A0A830GZD0_9CREN|nr:ABC transporter ATP-binding protein [Sulfodiicoccus acidiphilus]